MPIIPVKNKNKVNPATAKYYLDVAKFGETKRETQVKEGVLLSKEQREQVSSKLENTKDRQDIANIVNYNEFAAGMSGVMNAANQQSITKAHLEALDLGAKTERIHGRGDKSV